MTQRLASRPAVRGRLRRRTAVALALGLLSVAGFGSGLAAAQTTVRTDASTAATWPPFSYRVDEAAVRVQQQHGNGQPGAVLVLRASAGRLTVGTREDAFSSKRDTLLAAINALYRMRFFDLPSTLAARRSVFLSDDGRVSLQMAALSDTSTTTVCFTLPNFEKCVAWQTDPPPELDALAQRLLADALQAVRPAGPSKK